MEPENIALWKTIVPQPRSFQVPCGSPPGRIRRIDTHTHIYIYMGVVQKSFHFFPGLSQDLREAFASFRAWGFTTVGENGFSLGLEAFKDSCSCPGTSCVL